MHEPVGCIPISALALSSEVRHEDQVHSFPTACKRSLLSMTEGDILLLVEEPIGRSQRFFRALEHTLRGFNIVYTKRYLVDYSPMISANTRAGSRFRIEFSPG